MLTLAIVLAGFPVAWWTIGDLSETDDGFGLDYNFGRVRFDRRTETAVATSGLVVVAAASVRLLKLSIDGAIPQLWTLAVAELLVADFLAAGCARVLTAGTHGANIGGGMVLFYGRPILLAAYGVGLVLIVTAMHRTE